jgi:hypothetical protein
MRRPFFIFNLVLLLQFVSLAKGAKNPESIPEYIISKTSVDTKLPTTQSKFIITANDYMTPLTKGKIKYSWNGKTKIAAVDKNGKFEFIVTPGKYVLKFFYDKKHAEITTDTISIKSKNKVEITIHIKPLNISEAKPVIYLYPDTTTEIKVKLKTTGDITMTYPAYNCIYPDQLMGIGWNVMADPDGTIHVNEKKYNYLFWEGNDGSLINEIKDTEGFVIEKNDLLEFFETTLTKIGLNSKEQQDFITYWYPQMMNNEKNYIRFIFNETYDHYAHLEVTPNPDQLIRVFMLWSSFAGATPDNMKVQEIPSFTRKGFTLVEWGGSNVNTIHSILTNVYEKN